MPNWKMKKRGKQMIELKQEFSPWEIRWFGVSFSFFNVVIAGLFVWPWLAGSDASIAIFA